MFLSACTVAIWARCGAALAASDSAIRSASATLGLLDDLGRESTTPTEVEVLVVVGDG